jgi:hypothetical protein
MKYDHENIIIGGGLSLPVKGQFPHSALCIFRLPCRLKTGSSPVAAP